MNTGFGNRDSGFGRAVGTGQLPFASLAVIQTSCNFNLGFRFAGKRVGFCQIPNPVPRIPEFNA